MLRPECAADETFVRSLYHDSRIDEVTAAHWPASMTTRFLDDQFRLQRAHFATHHPAADYCVIETPAARGAPATPIGRLYVDRSGKGWRLLEIGLLQTHQGRGIGAALIRQLQREAGAVGASLALNVLHANHRAAALYQRLGFTDAVSFVPTHRAMIWRPGR